MEGTTLYIFTDCEVTSGTANFSLEITTPWGNESHKAWGEEKTVHSGEVGYTTAVTGISLDHDTLELDLSEGNRTKTLIATIEPDNATNKVVIWTSSDSNIAAVNNGTVTAYAEGTAIITATSENNPSKTATCNVTVTNPVVSITATPKDSTKTYKPQQTVSASDITVMATLSNGSTSEVTEHTVTHDTFTSEGQKTVTVTYSGKTATCTVTVVALSSISVTAKKTNYTTLETITTNDITVSATYSDGSINDVTGFTITPTNFTTGGTQTIKVSYTEDDITKETTYTVTVTVPVTGVTLNKSSITLTIGATETLTLTIEPDNASNKNVTWTSSDSNIASVDNNGIVTAVASGTATITVTSQADSTKTAYCTVTVKATYTVTFNSGNTSATGSMSPQTFTEGVAQNLTENGFSLASHTFSGWATSATGGKVYDNKQSITVTGNMTLYAVWTPIAVTGVSLNKTTLSLDFSSTNNSATLTPTILPNDAANKNVTWSSSDPSAVTVSNTGVVTVANTATEGATATITVTTEDGGKTATCTVIVTNPLKSIAVTKNYTDSYLKNSTIEEGDITVTATYSDSATATLTSSEYTTNFDSISITTGNNKQVTVTCTKKGVTKTTTFTVNVVANYTPNYTFSTSAKTLTNHDGSAGISGTYVEFGDWPQTIKDSLVKIDTGKTQVMGMFTYYAGSDGAWYCKVTENAYGSEALYKYSDGTQASQAAANSEKYFKVEPIVWRMLTSTYDGTNNGAGNKKLLLAERALMANVPFYDNTNERTINDKTVYANNYNYNKIRAWLNGTAYNKSNSNDVTHYNKGFLQTAFNSTAQGVIQSVTVDNSEASMGSYADIAQYVCVNTTDKIFLLSEMETASSNGVTTWKSIEERKKMPTDFALANNASIVSQGTDTGVFWWLRSPAVSDSNTDRVRTITHQGSSSFGVTSVTSTSVCIVPALCIP